MALEMTTRVAEVQLHQRNQRNLRFEQSIICRQGFLSNSLWGLLSGPPMQLILWARITTPMNTLQAAPIDMNCQIIMCPVQATLIAYRNVRRESGGI